MIQIVVGLFTHHDAVEAFRFKFCVLGSERRYEWKLFNLNFQTDLMILITRRKDNCDPKIHIEGM